MDGVGAAASVVTLIKISLKIVSLCAEYYSHVKNIEKNIDRIHLKVRISFDYHVEVQAFSSNFPSPDFGP